MLIPNQCSKDQEVTAVNLANGTVMIKRCTKHLGRKYQQPVNLHTYYAFKVTK